MFGRGSNEIASALTLVLEKVVEKFPESLTLWSDSCVPQNRNSIMCFALKKFLASHPNLKKYYSEIWNSRTFRYTRSG